MAVIDAVEEITKALDSKKLAAGPITDLKKAFDTIKFCSTNVWNYRIGMEMDKK